MPDSHVDSISEPRTGSASPTDTKESETWETIDAKRYNEVMARTGRETLSRDVCDIPTNFTRLIGFAEAGRSRGTPSITPSQAESAANSLSASQKDSIENVAEDGIKILRKKWRDINKDPHDELTNILKDTGISVSHEAFDAEDSENPSDYGIYGLWVGEHSVGHVFIPRHTTVPPSTQGTDQVATLQRDEYVG